MGRRAACRRYHGNRVHRTADRGSVWSERASTAPRGTCCGPLVQPLPPPVAMPVYIRKGQLEVPLPSLDGHEEEDARFELDPERAFARPPQPWRLVGQVLELVLERTWASVEGREQSRQEERTRYKPPVWDRPRRVEMREEVHCLAGSADGRYIFVGLDGGLAALAAVDEHAVLSAWEQIGTMITQINTAPAGEEMSAIATIDDMGLGRLFLFYSETFHLVKTINEVEDISKRTVCSSFILSSGGEYGGIMLQGNGESWFEIQKMPKEAWLKDLEQAQSQQQQEVEFSNIDVKLSSPILTLRLKSPKRPSGRERRPGQESSQLPEEWSTLGTGQNHLLSSAQLEMHRLLFQQRHRDAAEPELSRATVHFVLPSLVLPAGLEYKTASGLPNGVCMWWSGSHLLLHYTIQKTGKETEPKADAVWPNAELICCSTISECTMLLALGLRDGTITIWDRYLGLPLTVMSLPEPVRIAELHFVAPKNQHDPPTQDYAASPSASLMAFCKDGSVHMVEVNSEGTCDIATICQRCEIQQDVITAVLPLPMFPQLMIYFTRGGRITLHDRLEGKALALVALPMPHVVASPWDPIYTFGTNDQSIFIKAIANQAGIVTLAFSTSRGTRDARNCSWKAYNRLQRTMEKWKNVGAPYKL
ncbi:unnamed protein product [Lampetra planeri]